MQFKKIMIGASLALSIGLFAACGTDNSTKETKESTAKTTESSVDLNKLALPQLNDQVTDNEYLVEMDTTKGSIKIKLFPEQAPKAVENFVTHAKEGYYKDTSFHRVVKDFMIQGGDPKGDGTGGESIWKKGFKTEDSNQLYNIRGALSMARAASRSSNGSQFFIVTNNKDVSDGLPIQYYPEKIIERYKNGGAPQLDGEYTVFGQVTEGMDVVDQIAAGEVKDNGSGEESTPTDPVKVTEIKILQEPKK
ncbi:peptidylprolyl isomerase [Enterococcus dongliensis]|uniref:Peptidyl-prolyl cis-trans isomerase n=1 Tax=Enterococcus dongliensis TaxID=2559925 RepID=A0AAP5KUM6_9ENTE|nr:peptidylprolyl isomerase [Enterococcus dongliensis]MDT2595726.1 peptidylprolyl isomerase [Enterococcus dongliensis]MDT2602686.1 peptidylprolyl isomerase [Enterococcus dongliensis]MDT2633826.1 peptidylprolyl isomerase [Enterococcus dongliensis]MDT2636339.1 peptidylprolyl isomerase [Enterococcus dongliensis]MDT2641560.1 peptidylprolyl isomerase [Enterococcus dongliensis]